ncbi:unnamed protein product [Malus baccata var. baccata]
MAYLSMGEAHRRITDYLNRFSDADALNIFKCFYSGVSELGYGMGFASIADKELALNGKSPEKWKGAGSFLMKVFGVLALHLCRGVIRSIETARIFDFVEFP